MRQVVSGWEGRKSALELEPRVASGKRVLGQEEGGQAVSGRVGKKCEVRTKRGRMRTGKREGGERS